MPDYHQPHKLKAAFLAHSPKRKRCTLLIGKKLLHRDEDTEDEDEDDEKA